MKKVVSILIIMLAMSCISCSKKKVDPKKQKVVITTIQMKALKSGITNYHMNNNKYPDSLQDLIVDGIMNTLPKDAWGNDFIYISASKTKDCKKYKLISYGGDGKSDTEHYDGDSYNKDIIMCE